MFFGKLTTIFKLLVLVLLTALFLGNLYILVMQVAFGVDLPKVFGTARVVVVSGSMQPAIDVGDMLIIREQEEYSAGDIVTLRLGENLITHRIVEINDTYVITQGDKNNVADAPSSLSSIEGKMILKIPKAGSFILFLRTPLGILLLVFLALFIIEVPHIVRRLKGPKITSSGSD
jgi:signal peptidase